MKNHFVLLRPIWYGGNLTTGVRVCVCLCVHSCVRESERDEMSVCVCGKELFGVGYCSLAI